MNREALARRKSLLVAQSHLHRLQARMAWHDVRQVVAPPRLAPTRSGPVRSIAATLVAIAVPVFGMSRLGRVMRAVSIGMMIARIVRSLRSRS